MSCRTNHLPHSTVVTGEDTLLSWWNVASRWPRAHGYVLLVALTFSRSTLFFAHPSLFAFVAEGAKGRARRHGPELHRCLIACRLLFCTAYCSWIAFFYSSVYQGKLWYFFCVFLLLFDTQRSVSRCHTLLAESGYDTIWVQFRAFSSTVLTAFLASSKLHADSGALQTVGQREQLSGTTADVVV